MLAGALQSRTTGMMFYASEGGGDTADSGMPLPPFGVISVEEDEKMIGGSGVWQAHGVVVWVTKMSDTPIPEHSSQVGAMFKALASIGPGYDPDRNVVLNGIDIGSAGTFDDDARSVHGDTLEFSIGYSQLES